MQNSIYKIFVISVLGLGGVVFDSVWGGVIPPPERNTAWNKGRKCFHCLGAPNNLIRPCLQEYTILKLFLGQQTVTASEIHAGLLWTSDTTSLLIYPRTLWLPLLSTRSFRISQGPHRTKPVPTPLIQHSSVSSCNNSGRSIDYWNYLRMNNRIEGLHPKFVNINALGTKTWKLFPAIAWIGLKRRQKFQLRWPLPKPTVDRESSLFIGLFIGNFQFQ